MLKYFNSSANMKLYDILIKLDSHNIDEDMKGI